VGASSFIGGGSSNNVYGASTGIVAGTGNTVCDDQGAIVGGGGNSISSQGNDYALRAFIGAGENNSVADADSFIGAGGDNHLLRGEKAAIVSGENNADTADYAFMGAGANNSITISNEAFIGAGDSNSIGALNVGGTANSGGSYGVIGGGLGSSILGKADGVAVYATIAGGLHNALTGSYGSIAGGAFGTLGGIGAAIGGGEYNTATGYLATVPGGYRNAAGGTTSFAAGYESLAPTNGSFVWSDYSPGAAHVTATVPNEFLVRSTGGVSFFSTTSLKVGVHLAPGSGTWSNLSDRAMKTGIRSLDDAAILAKVSALPISEWSYTSERGVRHIGPMAQDFYAAFAVGEDDRHITSIDEDGVALAAVKALHVENATLRDRNAVLAARLAAVESAQATLASRLEHLERAHR
jgi:hypothetical protein